MEKTAKHSESGNKRAAFVLFILTPIIAEISLGVTPLSMAWLIVVWAPIYGAGILLIREAVVRTGRGWPSIILLGVAYEIVEDGIGLQALTSPNLYGAAEWGARILNLNLPYWEANMIYHVIFSTIIPILLTHLLFPAHRRVPYVKKTGLAIYTLVAILGVFILRVTVPLSQDPTYTQPVSTTILFALIAGVIIFVALKLVPRCSPKINSSTKVPSTWILATIGLMGTAIVLSLTFPVGNAQQPAFTSGLWVFVPMTIAMILVVSAFFVIRRWSNSKKWTDLHSLILAGGSAVSHSIWGAIVFAQTLFDRIGLLVIALITAFLLILLGRRIQLRLSEAHRTSSS